MTVQDDERERELVRMFNLAWNPAHQRHGVDATLEDISVDGQTYQFEIEVKSTTGDAIGAARDFGIQHIQRWRRMLFVLGFYSKAAGRPELQRCLCLTPVDLEPWLAEQEAEMRVDFRLAGRVPRNLDPSDLFEVCGEKPAYTIHDAQALHKQQWSAADYERETDIDVDGVPGYSPTKMLHILRLRAQYIAERGSTKNNPKVSKTYLAQFLGTNREVQAGDWAPSIRRIAAQFVLDHPGHPAAIRIP